MIIDHEVPHIQINTHIYNEGVYRADPQSYRRLEGTKAELKLVDKINEMPSQRIVSANRPATPNYYTEKMEVVRPKTPSAYTHSGPYNYSGPWNTTYRTSYNNKLK